MKDNNPRSYTTVEVAQRLGVSLPTVQRWVDMGRLKAWKTLGGHRRIDAESAESLFREHEAQLGHGTHPATDAEAAPLAPTALTALVVDDSPIDLELMVHLVQLALPGALVDVASDGFQALGKIGRLVPDLVITDIHMPHMNGIEMVRHLLGDPTMRPRLLIAVSAKTSDEFDSLGSLPKDVLFLHKPIRVERLVAAVREAGLRRDE